MHGMGLLLSYKTLPTYKEMLNTFSMLGFV